MMMGSLVIEWSLQKVVTGLLSEDNRFFPRDGFPWIEDGAFDSVIGGIFCMLLFATYSLIFDIDVVELGMDLLYNIIQFKLL